MQSTRTLSMIGFVAMVVLCTSCGGQARKPLYPTSGKVMYKKATPADGVLVIFTPVNETDAAKNWPEGFPRATTEKDGAFTEEKAQTATLSLGSVFRHSRTSCLTPSQ